MKECLNCHTIIRGDARSCYNCRANLEDPSSYKLIQEQANNEQVQPAEPDYSYKRYSRIFKKISWALLIIGLILGVILGCAAPDIRGNFNSNLMISIWGGFGIASGILAIIFCIIKNQEIQIDLLKNINK